jgi:hypothetical protein
MDEQEEQLHQFKTDLLLALGHHLCINFLAVHQTLDIVLMLALLGKGRCFLRDWL